MLQRTSFIGFVNTDERSRPRKLAHTTLIFDLSYPVSVRWSFVSDAYVMSFQCFCISSKYWKTVITFQHSFETKRGCSGICWNAKSTERNESFRQGTLYCTFTTQAYFQLAHITKLTSLLTDSNIPVLGRTFNFHLAHSGLFGVDARYKSHFTYSRS